MNQKEKIALKCFYLSAPKDLRNGWAGETVREYLEKYFGQIFKEMEE